MNLLKSLIIFCILCITLVKGKHYGVEYKELKCPNNNDKMCPIYFLTEIGASKNTYKLDYANYQNKLGKDFTRFEIICSGNFVDGYFNMDKVFRMLQHPQRVFDYSDNDNFYRIDGTKIIQLNSDTMKDGFSTIYNTYKDEILNFDNKWFSSRVLNNNVIYTTIGNHIDNGAGQILIDYAWVSIPDVPVCAKQDDRCQYPFILQPTYERDENRCAIFKGCVRVFKNPLCLIDVSFTNCPNGYKKSSITGKEGCPVNYCDPSFL